MTDLVYAVWCGAVVSATNSVELARKLAELRDEARS
jgi:hypothetical protein